jgi:hypothetical protein
VFSTVPPRTSIRPTPRHIHPRGRFAAGGHQHPEKHDGIPYCRDMERLSPLKGRNMSGLFLGRCWENAPSTMMVKRK